MKPPRSHKAVSIMATNLREGAGMSKALRRRGVSRAETTLRPNGWTAAGARERRWLTVLLAMATLLGAYTMYSRSKAFTLLRTGWDVCLLISMLPKVLSQWEHKTALRIYFFSFCFFCYLGPFGDSLIGGGDVLDLHVLSILEPKRQHCLLNNYNQGVSLVSICAVSSLGPSLCVI